MTRISFESLPKEAIERLEAPAVYSLVIKAARKETSINGFEMLVVENTVETRPNLTVRDNYSLFDPNNTPIQFGQYKLRCLLQATNTIPSGEFTPEVIAEMLEGKRYQAQLIYETYNEKEYLRIGRPESFEPVIPIPEGTPSEPNIRIDKPFPPEDKETLSDDDEI